MGVKQKMGKKKKPKANIISLIIVFSVIVMTSTNNIIGFVSNTLSIDLTGRLEALLLVVLIVALGFIDVELFKKLG